MFRYEINLYDLALCIDNSDRVLIKAHNCEIVHCVQ